jgi:predicted nucleic acid-binding protein
MIVLDTNVLSELMKQSPDTRVLAWVNAQPMQGLFITAVTHAEILYGIGLLPDGRKRTALAEAADAVFKEDFAGRILPFDTAAAEVYAPLMIRRRRAGKPMSQFDAQIAAIARSRGAAIATRNAADFTELDIEIRNPWTTL